MVKDKKKIWYAHIIKAPKEPAYIFIPGMKDKISKCFLFAGKTPLKFKQQPEGTFVYLDGIQLDPLDTIIEIQLK